MSRRPAKFEEILEPLIDTGDVSVCSHDTADYKHDYSNVLLSNNVPQCGNLMNWLDSDSEESEGSGSTSHSNVKSKKAHQSKQHRSTKDRSIKDRSTKDRSIKDHSIKDRSKRLGQYRQISDENAKSTKTPPPDAFASLNGKRETFYWTEQNTKSVVGTYHQTKYRVQTSTFKDISKTEPYDVCILFPKAEDTKENKILIPIREVEEIMKGVLKHHQSTELPAVPSAYQQTTSTRYDFADDIYGLTREMKLLPPDGISQSQLVDLFRNCILRVFWDIVPTRVEHVVTCGDYGDAYKLRLTEAAGQRIADESFYLLQLDRRVTTCDELRLDGRFIAPYRQYQELLEAWRRCPRLLWQRYDLLSQPMELEEFDATSEELSIFRDIDRTRLLWKVIDRLFDVEALEQRGIVKSIFMLHQPPTLRDLKEQWASFYKVHQTSQPFDSIRDYFGEEIGLYFAWVGLYTSRLWVLGVFGLLLYLCQLNADPGLNFNVPWLNMMRLAFSMLIIGWTSYILFEWTKFENLYRLRWGLETSALDGGRNEINPKFRPDGFTKCPIKPTSFIPYLNKRKYKVRLFIANFGALFLAGACILACNQDMHVYCMRRLGLQFTIPQLQWLKAFVDPHSVLIAALIKMFDLMFRGIVDSIVHFENHPTDRDRKDSRRVKVFFFQAFDYFSPLVYLAFFKQFISPPSEITDTDLYTATVVELRSQLVAILAVDFLCNAFEIIDPLYTYWSSKSKTKKDSAAVDRIEKQICKAEYTNTDEDFTELIIQFGLVTLFSLVCPIIPLLATLSNLVEIRLDAFKLAYCYRRPRPTEVYDIGAWSTILQFTSLLAVIMNVALTFFATLGHDYTLTEKLRGCVFMLCLAFGIKEFVRYSWPTDTKGAEIIRSQMKLVAHEALWSVKEATQGEDKNGKKRFMENDKNGNVELMPLGDV